MAFLPPLSEKDDFPEGGGAIFPRGTSERSTAPPPKREKYVKKWGVFFQVLGSQGVCFQDTRLVVAIGGE